MRNLTAAALAAVLLSGCGASRPAPSAPRPMTAGDYEHNVLALTWMPAWCRRYPEKGECRVQAAKEKPDGFVLHGLWPSRADDPAFSYARCGVPEEVAAADRPGTWLSLPPLPLSEALSARVSERMPGHMSGLDRHEWVKHGTCSGLGVEDYYAASLSLFEEAESALGPALAAAAGGTAARKKVLDEFEDRFGSGAVHLSCEGSGPEASFSEVRVFLDKDVRPGVKLKDALRDAEPPRADECPKRFLVPPLR